MLNCTVAERAHRGRNAPTIINQLLLGYFPEYYAKVRWGEDMSEDNEGQRWPAGDANKRWGNPPLWCPWNFQNPKPKREWQSDTAHRIAFDAQGWHRHIITNTEDENK
jgi:hypothetical protein